MRCRLLVPSLIILLGGPRAISATEHIPSRTDAAPNRSGDHRARLANAYGQLPLSFEVNEGQTDARIKFLSRAARHTLLLSNTGAMLVGNEPHKKRADSKGHHHYITPGKAGRPLRMELLGANRRADVAGLERLPGNSNYFIGNDPAKWRKDVPTYRKVRYSRIYPGVDLVYYGNGRQLEYDFIVAPGADPRNIRLAIRGAGKVSIDGAGDAVLHSDSGELRLRKPHLYQELGDQKVNVSGRYVLKGSVLGFQVANYDRNRTLVIDPVLAYSTYLGGDGDDGGSSIAVDPAGNAYVIGFTQGSLDFPVTPGARQPSSAGGRDVFVAKLNADGNALLYSTYLGGSSEDTGEGIAVDASGNAYIVGATASRDFPGVNLFPNRNANKTYPQNIFVTKLSPDGSSLVYSSYFGGSGDDLGLAIAVDSYGNAFVVGETSSSDLMPGNSYTLFCDSLNSGYLGCPFGFCAGPSFDGFLAKLNASGSDIVYSMYLGGSDLDVATAVAVDPSGENAWVAGFTRSTDFLTANQCPAPSANSMQPNKAAGLDGFVVKVHWTEACQTAPCSPLVYSTHLGSSGFDVVNAIAVDPSGNAYLTGRTTSPTFPVSPDAIQSSNAGGFDAFVAKLHAAGTHLIYSTYLGGTGDDNATGIAIDPSGNAFVTGFTSSIDFPVTTDAIQPNYGGGISDAFVVQLNAEGTARTYSTYLGGSEREVSSVPGNPIALDSSRNVYVTGSTWSGDFLGASASSLQSANGGAGTDAFIAKLAFAEITNANPTRLVVPLGTVTVGFSSVTAVGTTTATPIDPASAGSLPPNYVLNGQAFQIETTAEFTPPATVCIKVEPPVTDQTAFDQLRILHGQGGVLVDRTILPPDSPAPRFATQTICARVDSLSPFVMARRVAGEPKNRAPVAKTKKDLRVPVGGACKATITPEQVDDGSFDPDGDPIALSLDLTGPFDLGKQTVLLTVTDSHGVSDAEAAVVKVVDATPPTIDAPPPVNATTGGPGSTLAGAFLTDAALGTPSASDNCGTVTITREPPDNFFRAGLTTVTYTANDGSGNIASATQLITVVDDTPPVLTVPANITVDATIPGGTTVNYSATATDNVAVTALTCTRASGSLFPIGSTPVTCTAYDAARNNVTKSFDVKVKGAAEQIVDLLEFVTHHLPPLVKARLQAWLQTVLANPNNSPIACRILGLVVSFVREHSGTTIPEDVASRIIRDATRIQGVLGCGGS